MSWQYYLPGMAVAVHDPPGFLGLIALGTWKGNLFSKYFSVLTTNLGCVSST